MRRIASTHLRRHCASSDLKPASCALGGEGGERVRTRISTGRWRGGGMAMAWRWHGARGRGR
eukprot:1798234-Prymnesium_polylepis.1